MRKWISANLLAVFLLPTGLAFADDTSKVPEILTKWERAAAETRKPGRLDREHLLRVGGPDHSAHEIDAVLNFSGPIDADELTKLYRWSCHSSGENAVCLSGEPTDAVDSLFFSRVEVAFEAGNPLPVGVEFFDLAGEPKRQSLSVVCRWRSDASPLTPGINDSRPVMVAEKEPRLLRVAATDAKPIPKRPMVDPQVREILDAWAAKHREGAWVFQAFADEIEKNIHYKAPHWYPGPQWLTQGKIVTASAKALGTASNAIRLPFPASPIPVYATPDEILASYQIDVLSKNEQTAELDWRLVSPNPHVQYPNMRTLIDLETFQVIAASYYDANGTLKVTQERRSSDETKKTRK